MASYQDNANTERQENMKRKDSHEQNRKYRKNH